MIILPLSALLPIQLRGIGVKSQAKIRDAAKAYNLSYIKAAAKLLDEGKMGGKAGQGLRHI